MAMTSGSTRMMPHWAESLSPSPHFMVYGSRWVSKVLHTSASQTERWFCRDSQLAFSVTTLGLLKSSSSTQTCHGKLSWYFNFESFQYGNTWCMWHCLKDKFRKNKYNDLQKYKVGIFWSLQLLLNKLVWTVISQHAKSDCNVLVSQLVNRRQNTKCVYTIRNILY